VRDQCFLEFILELSVAVIGIVIAEIGVCLTLGVLREEVLVEHNADVNITVLTNVYAVPIRALCKDIYLAGTELWAVRNCIADRTDGILAARFLSITRRLSPGAKRTLPISRHLGFLCLLPSPA